MLKEYSQFDYNSLLFCKVYTSLTKQWTISIQLTTVLRLKRSETGYLPNPESVFDQYLIFNSIALDKYLRRSDKFYDVKNKQSPLNIITT